ncbi:MAG: hypothetical protein GXP14_00090, partial [Gammaproteobacteria bacterium]|nr:hypothetical protein [Gammaproteobacteria bacterium]
MKTKIDFKTKPIPFSGKLRKVLRPVIWAGFSVLLVACGGDAFTTPGNTGSVTDPITDPVIDPVISKAANIILLASTPTLGSASTAEIQLTAQIKDVNNALVEGEIVTFSATDGGLLVSAGTTNAAGLATASLSTAGDPANRTITVTATAGEQSANVDITVTGTTISISGESSVVFDDNIDLTIFLKDSEGNGIPNKTVTVSSANNNTLSANLLMTGASGEVPVTLTGTQGGADVITVSSLGSVAQYTINVSADQFDLTLPDVDLNIGVTHTIILDWQQGGNPVADGQVVNFSATRGSLSASSATIANGQASVTINSNNAGPSLITAFVNDGPTTSASIDFIATTPAKLTLQAASATIGPNGQNDAITAVVRDANNNLVKKIPIRFNIVQDNSNGAISNSTDTTDTLGRASTIYTSTAVTTARDGVVIQAEVENRPDLPLPCDQSELCTTVAITVAQADLFVRLGTSHLMSALDATRYNKPYNVLVTDSAGNARANVDVKLTLTPSNYLKGRRFLGS